MSEPVHLVFVSCPASAAGPLARALVEERHAACVNVLPPMRSVYRWQGQVEEADEVLLLIKAPAGGFEALQRAVRAHHPHELPEIVAVHVSAGLPAYLDWVRSSCA